MILVLEVNTFYKKISKNKILWGCPLLRREDGIDLSCCPSGHSYKAPRDMKLRLLRLCQQVCDEDCVLLWAVQQRRLLSFWLIDR